MIWHIQGGRREFDSILFYRSRCNSKYNLGPALEDDIALLWAHSQAFFDTPPVEVLRKLIEEECSAE
jgi:hypothetical protein